MIKIDDIINAGRRFLLTLMKYTFFPSAGSVRIVILYGGFRMVMGTA